MISYTQSMDYSLLMFRTKFIEVCRVMVKMYAHIRKFSPYLAHNFVKYDQQIRMKASSFR